MGSVYYYDQGQNIALRFKYATGKVYFLNYPNSLSFEKQGTFCCCIPTTTTRTTPAVGYTPVEDFGSGKHTGHAVTGVDIPLTRNEQTVVDNVGRLTKGHIYNMADLFASDYSKGEGITMENQDGTAYTRS